MKKSLIFMSILSLLIISINDLKAIVNPVVTIENEKLRPPLPLPLRKESSVQPALSADRYSNSSPSKEPNKAPKSSFLERLVTKRLMKKMKPPTEQNANGSNIAGYTSLAMSIGALLVFIVAVLISTPGRGIALIVSGILWLIGIVAGIISLISGGSSPSAKKAGSWGLRLGLLILLVGVVAAVIALKG
jgi:VIT1/CCC1 family predicted Fe2+/Mn2+ transporter